MILGLCKTYSAFFSGLLAFPLIVGLIHLLMGWGLVVMGVEIIMTKLLLVILVSGILMVIFGYGSVFGCKSCCNK